MKIPLMDRYGTSGRIPLLLLWVLGIPLPVIILIWLFRG